MVSSSSEMRQTPPVTVKKSDADCRPAAVKSGPSRVGRQHRTSHHEEPTVHCCLLALARPQFGGYKMIASPKGACTNDVCFRGEGGGSRKSDQI